MDIKKEFEGWNWLQELDHDLDGYIELKGLATSFEKEMKHIPPSNEKLEKIKNKIQNLIDDKRIYSTQCVTGRFINGIEDKEVALNCLKTLLHESDKALDGTVTAILFKKGLRKDLLHEKQLYLDLISEIRVDSNKQLEQLKKESELLEKRAQESEQMIISLDDRMKKTIVEAETKKDLFVDKLETETLSKVQQSSLQYEDELSEIDAKLESEKEKAQVKISNFIEAYKSEIQLKAPVSYWEDNKKFHRQRAKYFGLASLIIAPIIFALITWIGWAILSTEKVVWGKVGVILFATSLAVWLIRILVRMYLSHNHLELSSQERIIMTKSYLALLSEGGASSPEERQLVLQSIFRPSATGIITDDAAPPNIIELINRMPSRR